MEWRRFDLVTWPVSLQSDNFVTVTSFDDKGVAEAKELDVKDTGKAHAVRIRIKATSSENWVILSEISLTVSGRSRWWNARSHKLTFLMNSVQNSLQTLHVAWKVGWEPLNSMCCAKYSRAFMEIACNLWLGIQPMTTPILQPVPWTIRTLMCHQKHICDLWTTYNYCR